MTTAKTIILFLLTTFILLHACENKDLKQEVKTEMELSAQPGGIIYLDTTKTIHIATTLLNPTNDTLRFVSMTCSYEDMFLTDTSTFEVQSRNDCYSNFPTVIAIPPHSKIDQFIMVRSVTKDIKLTDSKIKVGMYYLTPNKENGFEGIVRQYENRQKGKVLWSKELDLKRLYRRVYQ